MSEVTLKGTSVTAAEAASRSAVLKRLRTHRPGLPRADARGRHHGAGAAERRHHRPGHRRGAGARHLRLLLPLRPRSWNPVTEQFGALAPIYGTLVTSAIAMLIAVPVGLMIAFFLTELCPPIAAPADRHRHRAAGRHPQHHLRHLGPVRVRAVPAEVRAAVPDRHASPTCRCSTRCSRARPTASAC